MEYLMTIVGALHLRDSLGFKEEIIEHLAQPFESLSM
jgi:hypothetical protein